MIWQGERNAFKALLRKTTDYFLGRRYMSVFNILTIVVGVASIIANIFIAQYNIGRNRKIYEIITMNSLDLINVNKALKNGDYTILHVSQANQTGAHTFVLGRIK